MLKFIALLLITATAHASYLPSNMNDGTGNPLTSQVNGSKRALDVGVNVAGVQVDPRARTWSLLNSTDSVNVGNFPSVFGRSWNLSSASDSVSVSNFPSSFSVSNFPATQAVSGTVTANVQGGNSTAVKTDSSATTQPISAASLPLPAGASTSANQATTNGSLSSIDSKTPALGQALAAGSQPVVLPAAQVTALTPLSSVAVTQPTGTNLHAVIDSGAVTATISGTPTVAVTSSTLPTGASTSALQTSGNASLTSIDSKLPVIGGQTAAASLPVTQSAEASTGSLTALNSTVSVITTSAETTIFQLGGTWVGTVTFEGSNDNFVTSSPVAAVFLGGVATQSASWSSNGFYSVITAGFRKIQARMSAYTSGTATVAADAVNGNRISVSLQGNPNNLQTLATQGPGGASAWKVDGSAVTQPVSISPAQAAFPVNLATSQIVDIPSAAVTTTQTSAAISTVNQNSFSFAVTVSAVSGTTPTLDFLIQESMDGVNWTTVYQMERITAAGYFTTPTMRLAGFFVRYVQTVAGTTPSFTYSLVRTVKTIEAPVVRRIFERALTATVVNSVTTPLITSGCNQVQIVQSSAAGATTAPVITLEGSEDGVAYYGLVSSTGTAVTVTGTASTTTTNITTAIPKFARGRVSTAGVAAVLNYVALKCFGL